MIPQQINYQKRVDVINLIAVIRDQVESIMGEAFNFDFEELKSRLFNPDDLLKQVNTYDRIIVAFNHLKNESVISDLVMRKVKIKSGEEVITNVKGKFHFKNSEQLLSNLLNDPLLPNFLINPRSNPNNGSNEEFEYQGLVVNFETCEISYLGKQSIQFNPASAPFIFLRLLLQKTGKVITYVEIANALDEKKDENFFKGDITRIRDVKKQATGFLRHDLGIPSHEISAWITNKPKQGYILKKS